MAGARLSSALPSVPSGLRGYARLFRSLTRDSLWRFRRTTVVMVGAGLGALALQAAAMGVAVGYAQRLQADAVFDVVGQELAVRDSLAVLGAAGVLAAGLLMLAALANYLSRRAMVRLRQDYEAFCTARAFELLGAGRELRFEDASLSEDDKTLIGLVRRDARFCGRTLGVLGQLIVPAATLVIAAGVLLYLAPLPTVVLVAALGVSAPWILRVNREAAQAGRDLEQSSRAASADYKRVVRWMSRSPFVLRNPGALTETFSQLRSVRRQNEAYGRRLVVTERAALVSGMTSGSALFLLVMVLGALTIRSGASGAQLLGYLLVLGRALMAFQAVNKNLSGINRFYPQVRRYFAFLDEASSADRASGAEVREPEQVHAHVRPGAASSSLESLDLDRPARLALVAPMSATRYTVPGLVRALVWKDPDLAAAVLARSAFVTGAYDYLPGRPLRETLNLEAADADGVRRDLEALGIELGGSNRQLELFPTDGDAPPGEKEPADPLEALEEEASDAVWRHLESDAKVGLAVLAAERSDARWVLIDENGLKQLGKPARAAVLHRLADRCTLIVHPPTGPRVGIYGERWVVAVDREGVLGIGDVRWFRSHPSVSDAVAAAAVGGAAGDTLEYEEMDDFDE